LSFYFPKKTVYAPNIHTVLETPQEDVALRNFKTARVFTWCLN